MTEFYMNWKRVAEMCQASAEAYEKATASDAKTDVHANVFLSASCEIVVAFRGSKTLTDFVQDFKKRLVDWMGYGVPSMRVHHGFLEDYTAISDEVGKQVRALQRAHSFAPVYITGHSLGGALAKMCAFDLHIQGIDIAGVYTFGSPRVGDRVWRSRYNEELRRVTYRFVNGNDIVPRAPEWFFGYRHCGNELFFTPGFGISLNPRLTWTAICDVFGLWFALEKMDEVLVGEHYIAAYQKQLLNYA